MMITELSLNLFLLLAKMFRNTTVRIWPEKKFFNTHKGVKHVTANLHTDLHKSHACTKCTGYSTVHKLKTLLQRPLKAS